MCTLANSAFNKLLSGVRRQVCKYEDKVNNKLSITLKELIFPKTHRVAGGDDPMEIATGRH